jgi:hypothetical protein
MKSKASPKDEKTSARGSSSLKPVAPFAMARGSAARAPAAGRR